MDELDLLSYRERASSLWLADILPSGKVKVSSYRPLKRGTNRLLYAKLYQHCLDHYEGDVRVLFGKVFERQPSKKLPQIIRQDAFLTHFLMGWPVRLACVIELLDRMKRRPLVDKWNKIDLYKRHDADQYHAIVGAPPTVLSKFFRRVRLKKDYPLLQKIQSDLNRLAEIEDHNERRYLALAILAHGAVYRELEGRRLEVPSFEKKGEMVTYSCIQHLIDEGVKTVSLTPVNGNGPGIYLCQGTELWPSQRATLGSILANFATHGSATAAYAHSWRRIHKHLRDLTTKRYGPPLVAGHSMGAALAIQISLYSHELIERSLAFNPPLPSKRDEEFFNGLSKKLKEKLEIHANSDDFAFWRIGERVFGNVYIWFALTRFRYHPITLVDSLLLLPAMVKVYLNLTQAFPAHQNLFALESLSLRVKLTPKEIAQENKERVKRFDYLSFFPKLYDPMRTLIRWFRGMFGWSLEQEYLQNEFEIILLHEQDLRDSMTEANKREHNKQIAALGKQKERLLKRLAKF